MIQTRQQSSKQQQSPTATPLNSTHLHIPQIGTSQLPLIIAAAQSTTNMPRHAHSRPLTPENTHTHATAHSWHNDTLFTLPCRRALKATISPHPTSHHIIHRCHLHDLTAYYLGAAQPFPPPFSHLPTKQDGLTRHQCTGTMLW